MHLSLVNQIILRKHFYGLPLTELWDQELKTFKHIVLDSIISIGEMQPASVPALIAGIQIQVIRVADSTKSVTYGSMMILCSGKSNMQFLSIKSSMIMMELLLDWVRIRGLLSTEQVIMFLSAHFMRRCSMDIFVTHLYKSREFTSMIITKRSEVSV